MQERLDRRRRRAGAGAMAAGVASWCAALLVAHTAPAAPVSAEESGLTAAGEPNNSPAEQLRQRRYEAIW